MKRERSSARAILGAVARGPVTTQEIASAVRLSSGYVWQVLTELEAEGLVRSKVLPRRGAQRAWIREYTNP
jgi:DNA-binding IscR family transcriptional regulator